MYKPRVTSTTSFLFLATLICVQESASAQYAPKQWYSPSYGRNWQGQQGQQGQQSNYQRAPRPNYYNANAAPNYQGGNVAVAAPPEQSTNHTVGFYENSARTEHGRRLGRMLDVYNAQYNDIGAAVDQVAERLQNLIHGAQSNQGQGVQPQNAGMGYNQNAGQNAYTKAAWSGGFSRYSKKAWVPYEEYMATKQGAGASWSPNAGGYSASKKAWSPWSKNKFAPQNQGYSQNAWSPNPGYSRKPWSPQNAWSPNQNAWSPNQNAWTPNPGYSKKTWSPFAGQNKQKWGDGYSRQPWMPPSNPQYGQQQVTVAEMITESPGMDADDFLPDASMTVGVESKSKKPRKEKIVPELDMEHHTESVTDVVDDLDDDLELQDHELSSKKSGEAADLNFDMKESGDMTIAS